MGYTHYWKWQGDSSKRLSRETFTKFAADCRKIINASDVLVVEESDTDRRPIVNRDLVRFNGYRGEGHETFLLDRTPTRDFCKTERKSYDDVVVACLYALKLHFPDYEVSTDGCDDDWYYGYELFSRALNHSGNDPEINFRGW